MTDDTLFSNNDATPPATPAPDPLVTNFDDKLSLIVNENGDKKYDTVDVALSALAQSQVHIPKLEGENASLRAEIEKVNAELAKRASIEDVVSKLAPSNNDTNQPPADNGSMDAGAIETLVRNMMTGDAQKATLEQNGKLVSTKLTEVYGDKAKEVVEAKAKELGLSFDQYAELSRTSPQVALAMFNQSTPITSSTTPSLSVPNAAPPSDGPVKAPAKSILQGATSQEQVEHFRAHRDSVYKKHGVVV